MGRNFWRMRDFSIFGLSYAYVYVDHSSCLAGALFAQNRIRVRIKGEMTKKGSPYRVVFCRVYGRDVKRFEEALEKLADKMLLLGHRDYLRICDDLSQLMESETTP